MRALRQTRNDSTRGFFRFFSAESTFRIDGSIVLTIINLPNTNIIANASKSVGGYVTRDYGP